MGTTVTRHTARLLLPARDTPQCSLATDSGPALPQEDGPRTRRYHHADMTSGEVARAVPPGSRRAHNQAEARDAALACPDLAGVRPRFREKLEAFYRVHVAYASWGGDGRPPRAVTSPGRATVCRLVRDSVTGEPMSLSAYKRCRRWWEQRGYIAVARAGRCPDLRPGPLRDPGRDHATSQAYVLCVPRRIRPRRTATSPSSPVLTGNDPLSVFCKKTGTALRARARHTRECVITDPPARRGAPRTGALRSGPLAQVTDGWWDHLTAPFRDWPDGDLLWAIDHLPGGRPHRGSARYARHPVGWLRWRLSHWLLADGTARPSPRQEAAERARRHRRDQARQHAELGLPARAAQLRVLHGTETAVPAPQQPWTRPPARQAAGSRLAGWAARRQAQAPPCGPRGPQPDPAWDAAVAAAVAAVAAADDLDRDMPGDRRGEDDQGS